MKTLKTKFGSAYSSRHKERLPWLDFGILFRKSRTGLESNVRWKTTFRKKATYL